MSSTGISVTISSPNRVFTKVTQDKQTIVNTSGFEATLSKQQAQAVLNTSPQINQITNITSGVAETGSLTGQFYPLNENPSSYLPSGQITGSGTVVVIRKDNLLVISGQGATGGNTINNITNIYNISGTGVVLENLTLTSSNITNKSIGILKQPITGNFQLDIVSGTKQIYGQDYTTSGSFILWSGYSLDGILEVGDTFCLNYYPLN